MSHPSHSPAVAVDPAPAAGGISPAKLEGKKSAFGLIDDAVKLNKAMESGYWLDGVAAGLGMAENAVGMLQDPLAAAVAMGVGIILDYAHPLSDWYDQLVGSPIAVTAASKSWGKISAQLEDASQKIARSSADNLAPMRSVFNDAAREHMGKASDALGAAALVSSGVGVALEQASDIIKDVRKEIREALADIVTQFAEQLLLAAATAGSTLAATLVALTVRVSQWATKISKRLIAVIKSIRTLVDLMSAVQKLLETAQAVLDNLAGGSGTMRDGTKPTTLNVVKKSKDVYDKAKKVKGFKTSDGAAAPADKPQQPERKLPPSEQRQHDLDYFKERFVGRDDKKPEEPTGGGETH